MGKAARLRQERAGNPSRSKTIRVAFCDVDYERASRAHGRGVPPAPPEGWVVGRSGLVHGEWNGAELRITGSEIIAGSRPASALVDALARAQLVVGHGVLTSDLRAVAMVTDVPDALLRRTVDLLAIAHRLRGGNYPSGCNLSDLAHHNNVRLGPTKQRFAAPWPGLGGGDTPLRSDAGVDDPCHDALIIAQLWRAMISTRHLAWGGVTVYSPSRQPGAADLSVEHVDELTGRRRQIEATEWRQRARGGRILLPTRIDGNAARLSCLSARDLPAPAQVKELADRLRGAGEIPASQTFTDEELYTACQYLGVQQNIDARSRILDNRKLTKPLRLNIAWALWQIAHPAWATQYADTSRRAYSRVARDGVASASLRMQTLNVQKNQFWARVAAAVA